MTKDVKPFRYQRATDVESAVALASSTAGAQFVAGGTSQVDLMKEGVQLPSLLVDLSALPLYLLEATSSGGLRIGANVKNATAAAHPLLLSTYPGISEAFLSGASPQIRNVASMAGNLLQRTRCPYLRDRGQPCNKRDPGSGCSAIDGFNRVHAIFGQSDFGAASARTCIATHPSDVAVAMAAHDAIVVVQGRTGRREILFDELHRLPDREPDRDTNLLPGDVIVAIDLPAFTGRSHYLKIRDRASYAYALTSCAVALDMNDGRIAAGRIALGGVAHKPWRLRDVEPLLAGQAPSRALFAEVAARAPNRSRTYASNAFKPAFVRTLVERALLEATGLDPLCGEPGTAFAASVGGIAGPA